MKRKPKFTVKTYKVKPKVATVRASRIEEVK